ncbi:MAG: hypothetical protein JWM07_569 [Candidatus Saccharibacteria bacterium]|nr:hypothetical protein [Candidatus Saccharibacteria bacterium]
MLVDSTIFPTIAVSDITKAKEFYGMKLGLKEADEHPQGVTYQCGTGKLFIYQSPTAGTSQSTCAAWNVDDVANAVKELTKHGIKFQKYEMPNVEVHGYVYALGTQQAAWFKDPDGNILSIAS